METDSGYSRLECLIRLRVANVACPLYETSTVGAWDAWIDHIPPLVRWRFECRECRKFIERYCTLVNLNRTGQQTPAILYPISGVPEFFREAALAVVSMVQRARVLGEFTSRDPVWGTPRTGRWTHLSGTPPPYFLRNVNHLGQSALRRNTPRK